MKAIALATVSYSVHLPTIQFFNRYAKRSAYEDGFQCQFINPAALSASLMPDTGVEFPVGIFADCNSNSHAVSPQ